MSAKKIYHLCAWGIGLLWGLNVTACFNDKPENRDKSDVTFMISEAYNITETGASFDCGIQISGANEKITGYGICYAPDTGNCIPSLSHHFVDNSQALCHTNYRTDTACRFMCSIDDIETPGSGWRYRLFVELEAVWGETDTVYNSVKTFTTAKNE